MNILLHPTYFPSISHYATMIQANSITFEVEDNFQKQTNRNRMYIYSPNGLQMLNIPVKHIKGNRQKFKDIRIENSFNWQKNHFKSLEAAYRTSPYFEYFEDDLVSIFNKKQEFMMDLNFQIFEIINNCLGIKLAYIQTSEYFHETNLKDFRILVNGKKDSFINEPYTQVFEEKHHFLPNLSILDLLFNEGRHAVDYLQKQQLKLNNQ